MKKFCKDNVKNVLTDEQVWKMENKSDKVEIFDFMASIWNPLKWKYVTDTSKQNNYFLFNRYMMKVFPIAAFQLNRYGIPTQHIIDYFVYVLKKSFPYSPPKAFYAKSKQETKKVPDSYTKDDKRKYMKYHMLGGRDVDEILSIDPDAITEWIKERTLQEEGVQKKLIEIHHEQVAAQQEEVKVVQTPIKPQKESTNKKILIRR